MKDNLKTEKRQTVLVIDDSDDIRRILTAILRRDYNVYCAENVDAGLRIVENEPLNLIVTDFDMPGKNGIQGIREIRKVKPQISIIMLTGSATREIIREALDEGARECMAKPFNVMEFVGAVRRYIGKQDEAELAQAV